MGSILMTIIGLGIKWCQWMFIKCPLLVLRFWFSIVKQIWKYLPLVAIALCIIIIETLSYGIGQFVLSKETLKRFNEIGQTVISFQLDTRLFDFTSDLINRFMSFLDNPEIFNSLIAPIAIILGLVTFSFLIGGLIFIIIFAIIILSWKVMLVALLLNSAYLLIKKITLQSNLKEDYTLSQSHKDDYIIENSKTKAL